MVRSSDADTTRAESGEKVADKTESLWPSSVCVQVAVFASQILIVQSLDADTIRAESGEKVADETELAVALERVRAGSRLRIPDLYRAIARSRCD